MEKRTTETGDRSNTVPTGAGPVPRVTSVLTFGDRLGMWKVRWGIGRMSYTIPPGLYALGSPDAGSEVLVTANFKMTFDLLRAALPGRNFWILVLDTKGVNVWCAAGKGTFGTDELISRLRETMLLTVVAHRQLILPQLGAVGIAAHQVREVTGFSVVYGPVRAADIPAFVEAGLRAAPEMRRKEFQLRERAALIPMELVPAVKWGLPVAALLSLFTAFSGPGPFSANLPRSALSAASAFAVAVFAGSVAVPLLLPFLPGRAFSIKGLWPGLAGAAVMCLLPGAFSGMAAALVTMGWTFLIPAASSFLALNFTGASTYTSMSGVRREMFMSIPVQMTAAMAGLFLMLGAIAAA